MLTFAQVSEAAVKLVETNLRGYIAPGLTGIQLQLEPIRATIWQQLQLQTDEERQHLDRLLTEWTSSLYVTCLLTNRVVRAHTEFVREVDQVENCAYCSGDTVQIGQPLDVTMNVDYQGRTGQIRQLLLADCKPHPLIVVQFDNGRTLHFWPQELRLLT